MSTDVQWLLPPAQKPAELVIQWQPSAPPAPPQAAAYIDERWAEYESQAKAAGKSLFNGPITQFLAASSDAENTHWQLTLAPGDYKTFLVTRLRDRPWFAQNAGGFGQLALGNSALVTRGNLALLGRRSPRVSCYAKKLHLIGGVLECLNTKKYPASTAGIIAHLRLELSEEIGLRDAELTATPRILGLAQDEFLGQPELFWQWETDLRLEKLQKRMDPDEHTETLILPKGPIPNAIWEQLTPVAQLAWTQWSNTR